VFLDWNSVSVCDYQETIERDKNLNANTKYGKNAFYVSIGQIEIELSGIRRTEITVDATSSRKKKKAIYKIQKI